MTNPYTTTAGATSTGRELANTVWRHTTSAPHLRFKRPLVGDPI